MSASWALVGLTELIAGIGDPDADVDLDGLIGRVAETLDVEVAAVCARFDVHYTLGVGPSETIPSQSLLDLAHTTETVAVLPSIGRAHLARTLIEGTPEVLLFARSDEPFTPDEIVYVNAVGRVLGMSTQMRGSLTAERSARHDLQRRVDDNHRLLAQLRDRQGLLDRLFRVHRSISHRAPTQEVLDAVTASVLDLLSVGRASLRLSDTTDPTELVVISERGADPAMGDPPRVTCVSEGLAGRCLREERLVVPGESEDPMADPDVAMAAPVHVNGEVVGCLTVSTPAGPRRFTSSEQEALLAFAESASLALQDARAIDAMRSALDRERHRAEHDPLTGLPNRVTVQNHLEARIQEADDLPLTVLFVDLDRFKFTNDTLGHAFGDEVLTVVSDRLQTCVRDNDLVGRLAGDEYVVICEGITEIGAIELAERIQAVIARPIEREHGDHVISASVGIARALSSDSPEQLIANADLAMYRAKQNGRARVEVFDRDFRAVLEERVSVGQDLRRALEENELVVFLQPVVSLPERRVVSFEALARWEHRERGLVMPDDFIPLAEDTGLIGEVDRTIVDETLRLVSRHDTARPVAVNLSARTFADPSLTGWLLARLAYHDVSPELLVIEVTETVLMEASGAAARQLEAIRALGVSVMIDDFGTGYSSLAYLQTFNVDGVKIDRSFTALLGEDARAAAIVAAVLHMADALDLVVVVEGVETDAQVNHVVELRDRSGSVELLGQGFLFGRPESGEQRLSGFVEVPSSAIPTLG